MAAVSSDDGYVSQSDEEEEIHQKFKEQGIPTPIIKIDNRSDNFATVVSMEFGDQLGELADTVCSPPSFAKTLESPLRVTF